MWNVLIVDDEKKVCELIRYLIPWDNLGLCSVGTVYNGEEAKKLLMEQPVDIVITDARMPKCDGIELVKWCHQQNKKYKFIVISGYRHFEYAHGALQYGVDYYLLKPISQKELIDSLKEIIQKLEQERQEISKNEQMQQRMLRNQEYLRKHFIGSYIFDGRNFCDRTIDSVEVVNEEFQLKFTDDLYRAIFIKVDNLKNTGYRMDKLLLRIRQLAELRLREFCREVLGVNAYSGVVIFLNYLENQDEILYEKIERLYEEIEKLMDVFDDLELTIGVSTKQTSIKGLHKCIMTAADAVKYRIVLKKKIISYDHFEFEVIPVENLCTVARMELLENYVRAYNINGIKKVIFDIKLECERKKNLSPAVSYHVAQYVSEQLKKLAATETELFVEENEVITHYEELIDNAFSAEKLWDCVSEFVLSFAALVNEQRQQQQTKPIRMVKEYIDEHYNESCTLEMIAEKVNLSANYISAVFKKEEGVNFLDYITAKRIEKASDYLRKTDMSMTEIAETVGYVDVKYFSKLFKKMMGMKPSEYRKLYS